MTALGRQAGAVRDVRDVAVLGSQTALSRPIGRALAATGLEVQSGGLQTGADTATTRGAPSVVVLISSLRMPAGSVRAAWSRIADSRSRRDAVSAVELARRSGATTLIAVSSVFAATQQVHSGRTKSSPLPESGAALAIEAAADRFAHLGGESIILRLGWPYGANDPITSRLIDAAAKGWQLLDGPPEAIIPTVAVADAATAVTSALRAAPAGCYDVTDDTPHTQGELAAALQTGTGRRLHPLYDSRWGNGPLFGRSWVADNARFKQSTRWQPRWPDAAPHLAALCRIHPSGSRALSRGRVSSQRRWTSR
ncbi:MAG: NAD(P)-dependent oxidoreductase [Acidimicrobiales bacterium]|nr:NAD(P)-dependent oxidoreductase [Acidimicrobiales bacterium]